MTLNLILYPKATELTFYRQYNDNLLVILYNYILQINVLKFWLLIIYKIILLTIKLDTNLASILFNLWMKP